VVHGSVPSVSAIPSDARKPYPAMTTPNVSRPVPCLATAAGAACGGAAGLTTLTYLM
jgi:hypothetical protein